MLRTSAGGVQHSSASDLIARTVDLEEHPPMVDGDLFDGVQRKPAEQHHDYRTARMGSEALLVARTAQLLCRHDVPLKLLGRCLRSTTEFPLAQSRALHGSFGTDTGLELCLAGTSGRSRKQLHEMP
jgi:hypothetical protein